MLKMSLLHKAIIITILSAFLISGCTSTGNDSDLASAPEDEEIYPKNSSGELPEWLLLSHRNKGFLASDNNIEEVKTDNGEQDLNSNDDHAAVSSEDEETLDETDEVVSQPAPERVSRPKSSGSPYEPGSIKDLIWHQRQTDGR